MALSVALRRTGRSALQDLRRESTPARHAPYRFVRAHFGIIAVGADVADDGRRSVSARVKWGGARSGAQACADHGADDEADDAEAHESQVIAVDLEFDAVAGEGDAVFVDGAADEEAGDGAAEHEDPGTPAAQGGPDAGRRECRR